MFAYGVASGEVTRRVGPALDPLRRRRRPPTSPSATATTSSPRPRSPRSPTSRTSSWPIVDGLDPDVRYDYVFSVGRRSEAAGSFRTLPPDGVPLRFAVVTCAKYNAGFFNAYRAVAERDDLHFVMHVGDYIYEAGNTPRGNQTPGADIGRPFEPPGECLTHDDYMTRYRAVPLRPRPAQACHARHAFWQTLDDHELADNAWSGGAEDHHEDKDGPWADRVRGGAAGLGVLDADAAAAHPRRRGRAQLRRSATSSRCVHPRDPAAPRQPGRAPADRRSELGADQRRPGRGGAPRHHAPRGPSLACPSVVTSLHRPGLPDGRRRRAAHPQADGALRRGRAVPRPLGRLLRRARLAGAARWRPRRRRSSWSAATCTSGSTATWSSAGRR